MTNKTQLCRIIYYSLAALHVSSDIFAHHQEHLNCITASGITHVCRCQLVSWECWNSVCNTRSCNTVQMLLMMSENIARNMYSSQGIINYPNSCVLLVIFVNYLEFCFIQIRLIAQEELIVLTDDLRHPLCLYTKVIERVWFLQDDCALVHLFAAECLLSGAGAILPKSYISPICTLHWLTVWAPVLGISFFPLYITVLCSLVS